jgi:hypothetical protein
VNSKRIAEFVFVVTPDEQVAAEQLTLDKKQESKHIVPDADVLIRAIPKKRQFARKSTGRRALRRCMVETQRRCASGKRKRASAPPYYVDFHQGRNSKAMTDRVLS